MHLINSIQVVKTQSAIMTAEMARKKRNRFLVSKGNMIFRFTSGKKTFPNSSVFLKVGEFRQTIFCLSF